MARYEFRLKSLEKVRSARRDQCRGALADAFRAQAVLAQTQHELAAEQQELRNYARQASEGILDVNRLLDAQRYELVLKAREQEFTRQEALLATETELRRTALVEAEREVRALALLDQRQRRAHAIHERRREAKQLDEAALVVRRRQAGES
jgi:flagellar export protein FliJ